MTRFSAADAPGALTSTVAALISFGIVPALAWSASARNAMACNQDVLRTLASFARSRTSASNANRLAAAAERTGPSTFFMVVLQAGVLIAIGSLLYAAFGTGSAKSFGANLISSTYAGFWHVGGHTHWLAFIFWTAGLTVAYAAHLLEVHRHAYALRHFLDQFNRIVVIEEGYGPVLLQPIGFGFSPLWVMSAVLLLLFSAGWSVAFAMAGATDRRLRRRAVPQATRLLANRICQLTNIRMVPEERPPARRPAVAKTTPVALCATPGCLLPLPTEAKFCPRCGIRRGSPVDRKI